MSESIELIREKAASIVTRMQTDSEFKTQVEKDPEGTLVAAGLPTTAIQDFLAEMPGEVNGYGITCYITVCPVSYLTN